MPGELSVQSGVVAVSETWEVAIVIAVVEMMRSEAYGIPRERLIVYLYSCQYPTDEIRYVRTCLLVKRDRHPSRT